MLNLAILPLSASGLERRILTMQKDSRPAGLTQGFVGMTALALVMIACSTRQPPNPTPLDQDDVDINYVRRVVLDQLDGRLENRRQYWAFFNSDWTLHRLDPSIVGAVEMSPEDARMFERDSDWRYPKPLYDVAQSLVNKEPELAKARAPGWPIYGSIEVISGSDTAWINWGHLAN